MTEKEAVEEMKRIHPKTCKMVNGRLQGGFDDHESESGIAFDIAIKALENQQDIKNALHDKKKLCQNFANRAYKQEQYARNVLKDEPNREDVKENLNNVIKWQDRNNALIEFIENLEDILN